MSAKLYESMVGITEEYLGPAAPRFISRQIQFHLDKKPEELTAEDIPRLVEWVKVSLALLTEDKQMLVDFDAKVYTLTSNPA